MIKVNKNAVNSKDFTVDKDGVVKGYASVYGVVDCYGDIIVKGAFDKLIESGCKPKVFFNHCSDSNAVPLGTWQVMRSDEFGLYVESPLNLELETSKNVYSAIKHGDVDGLSVCFYMDESCFSYDEKEDIRTITNVLEMPEISVCTYPANEKARITDFKSRIDVCKSISEHERLLRDAGLTRAEALAFVSSLKKSIFEKERDAKYQEQLSKLNEMLVSLRR